MTRKTHSQQIHTPKKTLAILGVLLLTLIAPSCTPKVYTGASKQQKTAPKAKEKRQNSKEFEAFLAKGTNKKINTNGLSPNEIIATAKKYMGVPHCMGGHSKKCTDCSGLIMAVFASHGVNMPHNSEAQARYGKMIQNKAELKKGDLVFFINSYKTDKYITHVGIYIGNNEFIHTSSKKGVSITSLNTTWWKDKFIFGTRIL